LSLEEEHQLQDCKNKVPSGKYLCLTEKR